MQRDIQLFHGATSPEAEAAAMAVLRSGQIASGPLVTAFERRFAEMFERDHVVSTDNMTSALGLALRLAGVGPGDEVMTLAYSCMSSNSAIAHVGATPVWVDIDPDSGAVDMADIVRAVTTKTKAVMVYHVAGYPGPARELAAFCKRRGLVLIEDCNNAAGSRLANRHLGGFGDYAVWSFYPNRQINALEGGMLACPDEATAARARRLRRFGIDATTFRDSLGEINPASDIAEIGGSNALSHLSAAVGLAHLTDLPIHQARTAANAEALTAAITQLSRLKAVRPIDGSVVAHWAFLVLADGRDELIGQLKSLGVPSSKLHLRNDLYSGFNARSRPLPGTDRWMTQVLALPCGHWLTQAHMDHLIHALAHTCR